MKKSIEITRFLNHIKREQNKIRTEYESKISVLKTELENQKNLFARSVYENITASNKIESLEKQKSEMQPIFNRLLNASRALLPKIRININGKTCTPRWFESGKWWSRETGGLDPDFIAEMTIPEISEAIEFYGTTNEPLMLPKSNRDYQQEATQP